MKISTERTLWDKYGKTMLMGLALFIVAYSGTQYYFNYQLKQKLEASTIYDNVVVLVEEDKKVEAAAEARELMDRYSKTPYAPLASLMLAKLAIEEGDLGSATKHLKFVINTDKKGLIHQIAKVRLARVFTEEKKYTEALDLLDEKTVPESFLTLVEEARGDIFILQNRKDDARKAYQMAMKAAVPGTPIERLQLKQVELGLKEGQ